MNRVIKCLFGFLFLFFIGKIAMAQSLPFHMPNGAGTFRLGVVKGQESCWIDQCKMKKKGECYIITHELWKGGEIHLTVRKLKNTNGFIASVEGKSLPDTLQLCWAYGACDYQVEKQPETNEIPLTPCFENVFSREGNAFTVYYGKVMGFRTVKGLAPLDTDLRLSDASKQGSPLELWESGKKTQYHVVSSKNLWKTSETLYYCFYHQNRNADYNYYHLPNLFIESAK